ncbi:hypothetical protein IWQ60_008304 [Tieghemiomyces parasiticus]|uniref:MSP domain-containing protein n=1 Tax=Tieghemiomyces parasiticus TaxID=78921 RepID=A0A9W7ZYK3_9FUNG|nr:hypothetical protein IWQ60_008304 [Tieghemiomyces parasiticus]
MRASCVGFKFKTNAPDKFSVKPVLGALTQLAETVEVTVRSLQPISPEDQFLIQTIHLAPEECQGLNSAKWRTFHSRRIHEGFINCRTSPSTGCSPRMTPVPSQTLYSPPSSMSAHHSVTKTRTTVTLKAATPGKRQAPIFSWRSVLEVPYLTIQLMLYLLYHAFKRISHFYSDVIVEKVRPARHQLAWALFICLLLVVTAYPLRRILFTPSGMPGSSVVFDTPQVSPQSQ